MMQRASVCYSVWGTTKASRGAPRICLVVLMLLQCSCWLLQSTDASRKHAPKRTPSIELVGFFGRKKNPRRSSSQRCATAKSGDVRDTKRNDPAPSMPLEISYPFPAGWHEGQAFLASHIFHTKFSGKPACLSRAPPCSGQGPSTAAGPLAGSLRDSSEGGTRVSQDAASGGCSGGPRHQDSSPSKNPAEEASLDRNRDTTHGVDASAAASETESGDLSPSSRDMEPACYTLRGPAGRLEDLASQRPAGWLEKVLAFCGEIPSQHPSSDANEGTEPSQS